MPTNNIYVQAILKKIASNEFHTQEELVIFLKEVLKTIENDEKLFDDLCKEGVITRADPNHINFLKYFVEYYNKFRDDSINLNLDEISSIEIDGQSFIKYKDELGNWRIIENNDKDKNFVEQIREKQSESVIYKESTGTSNAQTVLDDLSKERKEYELISTENVNKDFLSEEERKKLSVVQNQEELKDKELVFNPEANVYIDINTGESYYVSIDQNGNQVLRKTEDSYAKTQTSTLEYTDDLGLDSPVEVEAPGNIEVNESEEYEQKLRQLDDKDLEELLKYKDNLTEMQLESINREISRRKEEIQKEQQLYIPKTKVLMKQLNKPYNGFTSVLMIGLITSIYGVGFLVYLFLLIK